LGYLTTVIDEECSFAERDRISDEGGGDDCFARSGWRHHQEPAMRLRCDAGNGVELIRSKLRLRLRYAERFIKLGLPISTNPIGPVRACQRAGVCSFHGGYLAEYSAVDACDRAKSQPRTVLRRYRTRLVLSRTKGGP
jgi:hypothetical protein